jgi:hypothetical protein
VDFTAPDNAEAVEDALERRAIAQGYQDLRDFPAEEVVEVSDEKLLSINAYADASFAPRGCKSVGGSVCQISTMCLAWRSGKQATVATSATEAELLQQSDCSLLALGISELVAECGYPCLVVQKTDNQGLLHQAAGSSSWRSRHYRVRAASLYEKVERGRMRLLHQPGKVMMADVLTKGLGVQLHLRMVTLLRMRKADLAVTVEDILKSLEGKEEEAEIHVMEYDGLFQEFARKTVISFAESIAKQALCKSVDIVSQCQECAVCEVCPEAPKTNVLFTFGVALVSAVVGLVAGSCCRRREVRVQVQNAQHVVVQQPNRPTTRTVGVQSQTSYTTSGDRFRYLGSGADRHFQID